MKVVTLLWLNFSFIWKSLQTRLQLWTCCALVVEIRNFLSLQQVHNICNMFTTVYTYGNAFTSNVKQSHSHNNTFTTNLQLIQQNNSNTHNKARIPETTSQQGYDHCIKTSLQQVHNKMILYGNQDNKNTPLPSVTAFYYSFPELVETYSSHQQFDHIAIFTELTNEYCRKMNI